MKEKFFNYSKIAIYSWFFVTLFSSTANAQSVQTQFTQSITMIEETTTTLVSMVGAFTAAVVTLMGISSAVRTFRHVVLANV